MHVNTIYINSTSGTCGRVYRLCIYLHARYLWWSLHTLCLLACQVRVTIGNHDGYSRANNHDGYSRANNHDGYSRANNHNGYSGQTTMMVTEGKQPWWLQRATMMVTAGQTTMMVTAGQTTMMVTAGQTTMMVTEGKHKTVLRSLFLQGIFQEGLLYIKTQSLNRVFWCKAWKLAQVKALPNTHHDKDFFISGKQCVVWEKMV